VNYIQFLLFLVFVFSALGQGLWIYRWLNPKNEFYINKSIFLAEVLLLGAAWMIGFMVIFSVIGLYRGDLLWTMVGLGYVSFLLPKVREDTKNIFIISQWTTPKILFLLLIVVFLFRNSFFLFDVDSMRNYLYSQRVWLEHGTSIVKYIGYQFSIWIPQFDSIPLALGLYAFPQETLFGQFINSFWRVIVFLMLFGYTGYRFGGFIGLAAVMLVMFNDHMFYSGANICVIINAAFVGLIFATVYNFWESKQQNSPFRFILALIFASQILPNKYQGVYLALIVVMIGILIQPNRKVFFQKIWGYKKGLAAVVMAGCFMLLWILKNYLATGDPLFPAFAARFHALGWTEAQQAAFHIGEYGLKPQMAIKYLNYLFIWPGITAAKYVCLMLSFLPVILFLYARQEKIDKEPLAEFSYWMAMSVIALISLCMVAHWDPRYYRYAIAIFGFTAICGLHFIFTQCLRIKIPLIVGGLILILSMTKIPIVYSQEGPNKRPTIQENIDVLLNRIHTSYVVKKNYPAVAKIIALIESDPDKAKDSAYAYTLMSNLPLHLLPLKPTVGLYQTNVIKWDSYDDVALMVRDLEEFGIKWIIDEDVEQKVFKYVSRDDFARSLFLTASRHPKGTFNNYNFPPELAGKDRY